MRRLRNIAGIGKTIKEKEQVNDANIVGTAINHNDKYEGQWSDNKKNGKGILFYNIGTLTFKNGYVYNGDWKDNMYHGKGNKKNHSRRVKVKLKSYILW